MIDLEFDDLVRAKSCESMNSKKKQARRSRYENTAADSALIPAYTQADTPTNIEKSYSTKTPENWRNVV